MLLKVRKPRVLFILQLLILLLSQQTFAQAKKQSQNFKLATITTGQLAGTTLSSGIHVFKGIPYAAPPIGNLRWKAPQPPLSWTYLRDATYFGARAVQSSSPLYEFRSEEMSEDCLFLNVWTGADSDKERRPVYIFIHGGSFIHGDGSQPAYDGESMARQGIVYVSINYRLGVFGFLAHPELGKESAIGASGNYGLLDQLAAIKWVKENISAFGGDPKRITIGGESAGSQSVSAHLTSTLSKGLFAGAIAQSGSLLDLRPLITPLAEGEELGAALLKTAKKTSIAEMRSIKATKLLKIAEKDNPRRFKPVVDGYFLNEFPLTVFTKGEQADVPLLVGWNSYEVPSEVLLRLRKSTPQNFRKAVEKIYGPHAKELLSFYTVATNAEAKQAASDIMSDRLINYSAWNLAELQATTSQSNTFRYFFAQPHPGLTIKALRTGNILAQLRNRLLNKIITGNAFHASEIEYALGNLEVQRNFAWNATDYKVSHQMQSYFVNFIKNGNPNGTDLTHWPKFESGNTGKFLRISEINQAEIDTNRNRYLFLKKIGYVK